MKTQKVVFDNVEINIMKMNVEPASLIFTKLKKMLGGSIIEVGASVLGDNQSEDERKKNQVTALGRMISDIAERNRAEDVHSLWKEILCTGYVYKNGKIIDSLNDFDDLDQMYVTLGHAIALNYGDFVKKLVSSVMKRMSTAVENKQANK